MTKTAVAADDGDERRRELLGQIADAVTELGHKKTELDPGAEIHALRDEVRALRDQLTGHTWSYTVNVPSTATTTTGYTQIT